MKRILTLVLALGCGVAMAQKTDNVGIGTTKPDPSALLDLTSNSKGLLLPRLTEAQRDAIKNPAAGLVVFQTDKTVGIYTFDGTTWQSSTARVAATNVTGAWDKQGNAIDATDFLGSTNNFPLVFKVNGVNSGLISSNANTFLGYEAGLATSTTFSTGFGSGALRTSSGNGNTAFGSGALYNVTSNGNTAIGLNALRAVSGAITGPNNTAIGGSSLFKNTSGSQNVGIGAETLYENTQGSYNMGLGTFALYANTLGNNNVGVGSQALIRNQTGNSNVGIGSNALSNIVAVSNNVAIGQDALTLNTAGSNNTAIGHNAGFAASGASNVFIGFSAGYNEIGSNLLYIANSNTANPLIKGNFSSNWLRVNSKTTGYLAVGDFDATTPMPTPAGYRLIVQDGILTEKLKVALRSDMTNWADYVFEPSYKLMPLEEVEKYTKVNKHLPNVPSADEITKEGIDVAKVSKMFMEKIEELTLHIIELNKRIKELENKK
jgi:trimeric autotransporter adhesin